MHVPPITEDDARLAVDIAALELEHDAVFTDASDEGLSFLRARAITALRRYEAVQSQHERQRPFTARCEQLARRRAEPVRVLAHARIPGVISASVPMEPVDELVGVTA